MVLRSVCSIAFKEGRWRVSVKLPDEFRRQTRKRVHSVMVHGSSRDATRTAEEIAERYYGPRHAPAPYWRTCPVCCRQFETREAYIGRHVKPSSKRCGDCRDNQQGRRPIGMRLRFFVFQRDEFTCQYCGSPAPLVTLHVDHIRPVSKGGTNDLTNLITSCVDCNLGKHDLM